MPLIIVEGVDGSGKSTLISELSHVSPDDTQIRHCGPLTQHPLVEYEYSLSTYRPAEDTILCDRWHVGELVYGPLYRGRSELTPAMARHVELFLRSRGALRIIMNLPYELVQSRLAERGEDFLQEQHVRLVDDFYRDYAQREDYVTVDTVPTRQLITRLKGQAERLAASVAHLAPFTTYVGDPKPSALILGERRLPQRNRPMYPSALVPYRDSSGHFLLSALEQAGMPGDYGLANAGEENVYELWRALGKPPVIAMGNVARDATRAHEVPILHTTPHPQWIRRFAYAQLGTYGQEIKELIEHG